MAVHAQRLGPGHAPGAVLRSLAAHASVAGLPAPVALLGDWFDSAAVLAPEVRLAPITATQAFPPDPAPAAAADRHGAATGAPVVGGGWIGRLAYPDAPAPTGDTAPEHGSAEGYGGWADAVLRLDHDGCWWYESLTARPCPEHWRAAVTGPAPAPEPWHIDWRAPDRAAHLTAIDRCLTAIADGAIEQACICTAFTGTAHGAPLEFFLDAVAATAPTKAAFLPAAGATVASLSPETFLRRTGRAVVSRPIKGTVPATTDPAVLRASDKERAENLLITEAVRAELATVAVPGTARATELLALRRAPGVWHLVSTVEARLRPEVTDRMLVAATFPPSSVTGLPRGRARGLITRWEARARGAYCGVLGMVSPLAGLDSSVAVRTVEFGPHGAVTLGVGGGITAASRPADEWQECLDKAAGVIETGATACRCGADPIDH